ncbi:MAG: Uma2 family endonuclease [Planctomycetaceae bacterium]
MSTAEKRRLTAAEYLALEVASDVRHEFLDGEMFAMSGGSLWHNLIKDNFAFALRNRLSGRGCRVVTSDQRLKVDATGLYTYPDVIVFCGAPAMEDGVHHTLTNPVLVIEVLSDSTEKYDRGLKFGHYRRLPTLREYVVVAQDRTSVEAFLRRADEPDAAGTVDHWLLSAATDPAAEIHLGSLDVTVPLTEIYDGVEFPKPG